MKMDKGYIWAVISTLGVIIAIQFIITIDDPDLRPLRMLLVFVECLVLIVLAVNGLTDYISNRKLRRAKEIALFSSNADKLLKISKEYKMNYSVICLLLRNNNLPSSIIDYWLCKGVWDYGIVEEYCYCEVEVNRRLKLLELCVNNQNISVLSLMRLTSEILSHKNYFLGKDYPKDDYYLINTLLKNNKLPTGSKKQLKKYLKSRQNNDKRKLIRGKFNVFNRERKKLFGVF